MQFWRGILNKSGDWPWRVYLTMAFCTCRTGESAFEVYNQTKLLLIHPFSGRASLSSADDRAFVAKIVYHIHCIISQEAMIAFLNVAFEHAILIQNEMQLWCDILSRLRDFSWIVSLI